MRSDAFAFIAAFFVVFAIAKPAPSQEIDLGPRSNPLDRQSGQFATSLRLIREYYAVRDDKFVVEGNKPLGLPVLAAEEVIFKPGSRLLVSASHGGDPAVYIIANKITVEGKASISWRRDLPIDVPPPRAKAPSGAFGRADGEKGERGYNGEPGNIGFSGAAAPTLFVVARDIGPGALTIDLRGQDGGQGGRGQEGGDGGNGANGFPGSQSLFDCKQGPGRGGDGGNGGDGGPGGMGGEGGNGGDVYLLTSAEANVDNVAVYNSGGRGGTGGQAGFGGRPGRPGRGGHTLGPFCRSAGENGSEGTAGVNGQPSVGRDGRSGTVGRFFTSRLNDRMFNALAE